MSSLVEVAVLLMAYGTPSSEDEVAPSLTGIRHGRPPGPDAVEELKQRFPREKIPRQFAVSGSDPDDASLGIN